MLGWQILLVVSPVAILAVACFAYMSMLRKHRKYWNEQGVDYWGGTLIQNLLLPMKGGHMATTDQKIYDELKKRNTRLLGMTEITQNSLMVSDIEVIKSILIKDFDHFVDRRIASTKDREVDGHISKMVFSLEGEEWKDTRIKLSPTFTTGKIKRMFKNFDQTCHKMVEYIKVQHQTQNKDLEYCSIAGKFTLDTIAEAAFGVDSKAFNSKEPQYFENMVLKLTFKFTFMAMVKLVAVLVAPKIAAKFNISLFDKEADDFFSNILLQSIKERKNTDAKFNDFLQILLEAREGKSTTVDAKELDDFEKDAQMDETKLYKHGAATFDDDFIISQIILFLLAGFDTTQSLLVFVMYQLALNQDAQERLHEEVSSAYQHDGEFTYENIMKLEYLDQVINETLRMYPPLARTERICTKSYTVPGRNVRIEKGSLVAFPVMAIHYDPEYYEDPDSFKPERFSLEEKKKRSPYTFLPFGHGPRNCIGMRFALAESKLAVCHIVKNFMLEPCNKTEIPVKFSLNNILKPRKGMWLKTTLR